jgi:Asp-tRNA(Asn)/Glu-tRNA(Gln) amidotransferase A subunit family amidase
LQGQHDCHIEGAAMHRNRAISRRDFLLSTASATVGTLLGHWTRLARADSSDDDLTELSVATASAAIRKGDLSAERYVAAVLARCDRLSHLTAFVALDRDAAMHAARDADRKRADGEPLGALHGIPLAIKDNINTAALPTAAGTRALRNSRPKEDAPIVTRLTKAGAFVLGKTNMHELAMGYTTTNGEFGATHNPYDISRIPGGSSGGTGAAVAARMAPAGLGSDTGGSVRIPASLCGICGLRPSSGRYPSIGIAPLSSTLDTAGPMARTMEDVALLDAVITGEPVMSEPVSLRGVRIGIPRAHYYEGLDVEVERVSNGALARLRDAGAVLVEAEVPGLTERNDGMIVRIAYFEFGRAMPEYLAHYHPNVSFQDLVEGTSPDIRKVIEDLVVGKGPKVVTEQNYREAMDKWRPELQAMLRGYFARHELDMIAFPPCRVAAPTIPDPPVSPGPEVVIGGKVQPPRFVFGRNVTPSSNAGMPGLVIPAGMSKSGLPIGLEFDAPEGKDRWLLALGLSMQRVLGAIPAPSV